MLAKKGDFILVQSIALIKSHGKLDINTGITVSTNKGGNVHTFPYDIGNPTGPSRIKEQMYQSAIEAETSGKKVL